MESEEEMEREAGLRRLEVCIVEGEEFVSDLEFVKEAIRERYTIAEKGGKLDVALQDKVASDSSATEDKECVFSHSDEGFESPGGSKDERSSIASANELQPLLDVPAPPLPPRSNKRV